MPDTTALRTMNTPIPAGLHPAGVRPAASAAEEAIHNLRCAVAAEEDLLGSTRFTSDVEVAWARHRLPLLKALAAEARAVAATSWPGSLDALLDKLEDIRSRVPPRTWPEDFQPPEWPQVRAHLVAQRTEKDPADRAPIDAGLRDHAHPQLQRVRGRLEELHAEARREFPRAVTPEKRREVTLRIHRLRQSLDALAEAEINPPLDPVAAGKKILREAEGGR